MNEISFQDKKFVKYIGASVIEKTVDALAQQLDQRYHESNPVLISVLDGSFIFTADLVRQIGFRHELAFVKLQSYFGTKSSGEVQIKIPLDRKIEGREIIIVEDIVDTGTTLFEFIKLLNLNNPKSISICSLLLKPLALNYDLPLEFIGKKIPNDFVIGYGMDIDGQGRNLKDIYSLEKQ